MGRGSSFLKKKEQNLDNLKLELELDVHRGPIDELCKRWNPNAKTGRTDGRGEWLVNLFVDSTTFS